MLYLSFVAACCYLYVESSKDRSQDPMSPLTVGLMILLGIAMTFITLIAIMALRRRRHTGYFQFFTHIKTF